MCPSMKERFYYGLQTGNWNRAQEAEKVRRALNRGVRNVKEKTGYHMSQGDIEEVVKRAEAMWMEMEICIWGGWNNPDADVW